MSVADPADGSLDFGVGDFTVEAWIRDVGLTVYVDGVSKATAGALAGSVSNAGPLLIGKATGYVYFSGQIDEVRGLPGPAPRGPRPGAQLSRPRLLIGLWPLRPARERTFTAL